MKDNVIHKVYPKPVQRSGERVMIDNLSRIAGIDKMSRCLEDKIRMNPLNFMGILIWKLELEKLAFNKEKLLKRNKHFSQNMEQKSPRNQRPCKPPAYIGFVPIALTALVRDIHERYEANQTSIEKTMEQKEKSSKELKELHQLREQHSRNDQEHER